MPASPSLLIVPARFKTGKLYTQIATTSAGVVLGSSGDFNVTRATTATRVNANGFIESVASGVPRLDYYTSGGTAGCPALLVEASGSNLALQSEDFSTTWGRVRLNAFGSGSVANTTGTLDPYGTNLADYLQEDTAAADTHRIQQTIVVVSGTTYTISCFLKSAERFQAALFVLQGGVSRYVVFNLASGTATATDATGSIENYGNGWYRGRATFTATASENVGTILYLCDDSGNISYTGTGTKGIYAFGFQFEASTIATSYIPTTAAAVTRNADVVTLSGAVSGCIGQTEGTLYTEFEYKTNAAERRLIALSNGTTLDRVMVWTQNNALFVQVEGGTTTLANPITEGYHKLAFAYQQNGVSGTLFASLDGDAVVSGTSAAFPASLTDINIGKTEATATSNFFWNARIRAAALYTSRLSNAELIALSTL
jgi:hypothetical protein